jgi:hypothetical protein
LDVDLAVADHDCFIGAYADLVHEGAEAEGIGLFEGEGVSTIDVEEVAGEAEAFADAAGGANGLVGKHSHNAGGGWGYGVGVVEGMEGMERVEDSFVGVGEVEFMSAVVVEKEGVGLVLELGVDLLDWDVVGGGEGAAEEHRCTVADEAGYGGIIESGAADVLEGGVDAVAEILGRIDEGAVEVEYEEFQAVDGDGAEDVDHGFSVTRDQMSEIRDQMSEIRDQRSEIGERGSREQKYSESSHLSGS